MLAGVFLVFNAFLFNLHAQEVCDDSQKLNDAEAAIESLQSTAAGIASSLASGCTLKNDGGKLCFFKIDQYPRPIAVIVPKGFDSNTKFDLLLYLHGDNPFCKSLEKILGQYRIYEEFQKSQRKDALLVVPQGCGTRQEHGKDFVEHFSHEARYRDIQGGMQKKLEESGLVAKGNSYSDLVIGAHSGAYKVLKNMLHFDAVSKKLKEVYLFDATYGGHREFAEFAKDESHRFWTVFTGATAADTACLAEKVSQVASFYGCAPKSKLCGIKQNCKLSSVPPSEEAFKTNRVGFIFSGRSHNEIVTDYYSLFFGGKDSYRGSR